MKKIHSKHHLDNILNGGQSLNKIGGVHLNPAYIVIYAW